MIRKSPTDFCWFTFTRKNRTYFCDNPKADGSNYCCEDHEKKDKLKQAAKKALLVIVMLCSLSVFADDPSPAPPPPCPTGGCGVGVAPIGEGLYVLICLATLYVLWVIMQQRKRV
jgi:hypothetical protein